MDIILSLEDGDLEEIQDFIDFEIYTINSDFTVTFPNYYSENEYIQVKYRGNLLSYLAGIGILSWGDEGNFIVDEQIILSTLEFLLKKGADPESTFEDTTGGLSSWNFGAVTSVSLLFASEYDDAAQRLLDEIISKRIWTEDDTNETLAEINSLHWFHRMQHTSNRRTRELTDILRGYEEQSLRLNQERKNKATHKTKMKSILNNLQRHPTRKRKRNLLRELNFLPPIEGISHEGGPGYRKSKEIFTRMSQGEPIPPNLNYLTRKNYNWKRAEKYMK